jgi:hypothetical protein
MRSEVDCGRAMTATLTDACVVDAWIEPAQSIGERAVSRLAGI